MKKIHVGLYLGLDKTEGMDLSHPENGNPGFGGTPYCFLLLARFLNHYQDVYIPVLYTNYRGLFPANVKVINVRDIPEAIRLSKKNNDLCLVLKNNTQPEIIDLINHTKHKIVFWSHNFFKNKEAEIISGNKYIVANVFVGKQMYDKYIDHDIIKKSTFIYNIVTDPLECTDTNRKRKKEVVYMGSIIPSKGFLETLKIWKIVEKQLPDAKLKVLGSGNLYTQSAVLGPLGLAEENYEKQLLPYLVTKDGQLKENIELLGVVGNEKYDIFLDAAVGIVNPTAETETFCLGVVEMAAAALPVVTRKANGLCDTVINRKTGCLFYTYNRMAKEIITLLTDTKYRDRLGQNAKTGISRFSPAVIIPQWISLFSKLDNFSEDTFLLPYQGVSKPYWNDLKYLRYLIRIIRFNLRLKFVPALLKLEYRAGQLVRKIKNK